MRTVSQAVAVEMERNRSFDAQGQTRQDAYEGDDAIDESCGALAATDRVCS
jgi:hypothetical protein